MSENRTVHSSSELPCDAADSRRSCQRIRTKKSTVNSCETSLMLPTSISRIATRTGVGGPFRSGRAFVRRVAIEQSCSSSANADPGIVRSNTARMTRHSVTTAVCCDPNPPEPKGHQQVLTSSSISQWNGSTGFRMSLVLAPCTPSANRNQRSWGVGLSTTSPRRAATNGSSRALHGPAIPEYWD